MDYEFGEFMIPAHLTIMILHCVTVWWCACRVYACVALILTEFFMHVAEQSQRLLPMLVYGFCATITSPQIANYENMAENSDAVDVHETGFVSDVENKAPEEAPVFTDVKTEITQSVDPVVSPECGKRRRAQHDYRRLSSSGYMEDTYCDYRQRYSSTSDPELSPSPNRQKHRSSSRGEERDLQSPPRMYQQQIVLNTM